MLEVILIGCHYGFLNFLSFFSVGLSENCLNFHYLMEEACNTVKKGPLLYVAWKIKHKFLLEKNSIATAFISCKFRISSCSKILKKYLDFLNKYQNLTLYTQINSSNHKNFPYDSACYHINGA